MRPQAMSLPHGSHPANSAQTSDLVEPSSANCATPNATCSPRRTSRPSTPPCSRPKPPWTPAPTTKPWPRAPANWNRPRNNGSALSAPRMARQRGSLPRGHRHRHGHPHLLRPAIQNPHRLHAADLLRRHRPRPPRRSRILSCPACLRRDCEFALHGAIYHQAIARDDGEFDHAGPLQHVFGIVNKQTFWLRYRNGPPRPSPSGAGRTKASMTPSNTASGWWTKFHLPRRFRKGEPILQCVEYAGDHLFVDRLTYNFRRPETRRDHRFQNQGHQFRRSAGPVLHQAPHRPAGRDHQHRRRPPCPHQRSPLGRLHAAFPERLWI